MASENLISIEDHILTQINLIQETSIKKIRSQLILLITELINTNFNRLLQMLYRIDIDEIKLKQSLNQNKESDAALIITDLIISRQLQKILIKKQTITNENISPDESW